MHLTPLFAVTVKDDGTSFKSPASKLASEFTLPATFMAQGIISSSRYSSIIGLQNCYILLLA